MTKKTPYLRDVERLDDDLILPSEMCSLGGIEYIDKRHAAVVEVLLRIPDDPYQYLIQQIDSIEWLIPHKDLYGKVFPVTAKDKINIVGVEVPGRRIIYLSPKLENATVGVRTAVVAHELAHIALKHKLRTASLNEYDQQEREVFRCLIQWGFEQEAKSHRASLKKRHFK